MDRMLLRAFQRQVLTQCRYALYASEYLTAALNGRVENERVFFAVEGMLNAAANLSKALWGASGGLAEERRPLRESLDVKDESALADVDMRNHFEHIDERMDRWWKLSEHHIISDMNVGVGIQIATGVDEWRHYMPQTGEVWFFGERFSLPAILAEVQSLLPKVEAEAKKPHWED
jgi:hypothetical protein